VDDKLSVFVCRSYSISFGHKNIPRGADVRGKNYCMGMLLAHSIPDGAKCCITSVGWPQTTTVRHESMKKAGQSRTNKPGRAAT